MRDFATRRVTMRKDAMQGGCDDSVRIVCLALSVAIAAMLIRIVLVW